MYAIFCNKYNFFPKDNFSFRSSNVCMCCDYEQPKQHYTERDIIGSNKFSSPHELRNRHLHHHFTSWNRLIFIFRLQIVFTKSIKILQHSTSPLLREIRSLALNGFYGFFLISFISGGTWIHLRPHPWSIHNYPATHQSVSISFAHPFSLNAQQLTTHKSSHQPNDSAGKFNSCCIADDVDAGCWMEEKATMYLSVSSASSGQPFFIIF